MFSFVEFWSVGAIVLGTGATVFVTMLVTLSSGVVRNCAEVSSENFSSGKWFGMAVVANTSSWLSDTARACLATLLPCERSARDQPAVHASKSNWNTGKTNILHAAHTLAPHVKGWNSKSALMKAQSRSGHHATTNAFTLEVVQREICCSTPQLLTFLLAFVYYKRSPNQSQAARRGFRRQTFPWTNHSTWMWSYKTGSLNELS